MSLQDRITVSTVDTMRRLEQGLDRLRRFQYDSQYHRLLGGTLMDHLETWDSQIRSRRNDPFTVAVVGEFKRGKSSFINALLGEEIMVTDVVPETVTMNKLSYGIHKNEAILSGGRRLTLSDEELSRSALERLMGEAGEPIRQLELWRPNGFLKDVRIIDTPGLNDVTDDQLDAIVAEAMAQADAVIYIYSVNAPLSRSEQMYVRYAILPQQYTKLFLVGNYCDLLEKSDALNRMRAMLRQRTELLLPGEKTYLISALDELCRVLGHERPCQELAPTLEREFEDLRQAISELIQEKKTVVAADRMLRMTSMMAEDIRADIHNIEKGLEMNANQLAVEKENLQTGEERQSKQLEEAKEKITRTVEAMKSDAVRWVGDLLRRMEREDLSTYSVQDISQYYAYYCIDLLQNAAQECLELHREQLLEQMSDISDELGKDLAGMYTAGDKLKFCFRLNNTTWTRGDSITLAITQVSGNAVINALADLAGSMTRKTEIEADKDKLLANIKSKYPNLMRETRQKLDSQYAGLARAACALLEKYYQEQIQRARETVAQYEEASKKSSEDKQKILQAASELCQVLDTFCEA